MEDKEKEITTVKLPKKRKQLESNIHIINSIMKNLIIF